MTIEQISPGQALESINAVSNTFVDREWLDSYQNSMSLDEFVRLIQPNPKVRCKKNHCYLSVFITLTEACQFREGIHSGGGITLGDLLDYSGFDVI